MKIFESASIGPLVVKNRIVRSATFEGVCDGDGVPQKEYRKLYGNLAQNGVATIITGFTYVSKEGSALQPGQAGLDNDDKIPAFREVTDLVHQYDSKIFIQLAHTGRQTRSCATGYPVLGVSRKASPYFREIPKLLTTEKIYNIIEEFVSASVRAKRAGFDGVQLHAAHGYLIHQFIHPFINKRNDEFGIDSSTGIGLRFLELIIAGVHKKCGKDFPILIKVSGSDDFRKPFTEAQFINLIKALNQWNCDAIEVSYGTMSDSFNIMRAQSIPLDVILDCDPVHKLKNPILREVWKKCAVPFLSAKLKTFTPLYNYKYALTAKKHSSIPIITVGGFRRGEEIRDVLERDEVDFVALSRPFLIAPDFISKLKNDPNYISKCTNCNICAVKTAVDEPTRCIMI